MRTLVLGGARSGKSAYAESLLAGPRPVRYVATLHAAGPDPETAARIRRHRARRPASWEVVEAGADLAAVLAATPPGHRLLVDGLTLWLAALLDRDPAPEAAFGPVLDRLKAAPEVVVVSEEVGGGIVPPDPLARRYVDLAGALNQRVAALCDRVVLVAAGLPLELKAAS
jgi:adenosylcobinamide kinase/adenosylcobinamide-phosphate guanylyltransferase